MRGEYWIHDGMAVFCDGDIGDFNHEGYVMDCMARTVAGHFGYDDPPEFMAPDDIYGWVVERLTEDGGAPDGSDTEMPADVLHEILEREGDAPELLAWLEASDAREYAMKFLGWKAVRGNHIESWTLTRADCEEIADGLWDIGEDCLDEEFHISAYARGDATTHTATGHQIAAVEFGLWRDMPDTSKVANAAVDKMDAEMEHPYYKNKRR